MTKNILSLIDFSDVCDRIITRTGDLAKYYDAKCWLIHVAAPDPDFVGYDVGPQYIRDSRAEVLQKELHQMNAYRDELTALGIECEALLIQGQINPTLMAEIERLEIDLVILGSHGRSKLYDLVVGSVCEYMLRHATLPTLVIPSTKAD
jgi:nucleotide-binding universal stress UspA family protein